MEFINEGLKENETESRMIEEMQRKCRTDGKGSEEN